MAKDEILLQDLRKNWLKLTFIGIQMTIVVLLMTYLGNYIQDTSRVLSTMNRLMDKNEVYFLQDLTETSRFERLMRDDEYFDEMLLMDDKISQNKLVERLILNSSREGLFSDTYGLNALQLVQSEVAPYHHDVLEVTGNFFEIFGLLSDEDSERLRKDFDGLYLDNGNIPVVLGSDYRKRLSVGDVFSDYFGRRVYLLTSQTLPTQCHLTYMKSMALGYKLLAL